MKPVCLQLVDWAPAIFSYILKTKRIVAAPCLLLNFVLWIGNVAASDEYMEHSVIIRGSWRIRTICRLLDDLFIDVFAPLRFHYSGERTALVDSAQRLPISINFRRLREPRAQPLPRFIGRLARWFNCALYKRLVLGIEVS